MDGQVPDEVRELVFRCIRSVAELETLVVLQRDAQRAWTDADLAPVVGVGRDEAGRAMFDLMARGLLRLVSHAPLAYSFGPKDPRARRLVDALAALHAERRAAVVDLVASRPRQSLRLFADAFRVRPGGAGPAGPDRGRG